MECASCHYAIPLTAQFCEACGAARPARCPQCNEAVPATANFCRNCGEALPHSKVDGSTTAPSAVSAAPEGERRQATVLFADLSGYTALNERFDPEEVRDLMGRIKAKAVEIVEQHGGIVSQFVGDEVLALFGIPIAHEDDPIRAVRAAVHLHDFVRTLSPETEGRIGQPIRLHTGINTGLLVTSTRDDRDGRVGITGDAVNIGAWLKALAGVGGILVSRETFQAIEGFFETEALPPLTMKGRGQAITPYRILSEVPAATRFGVAKRRGLTPLVGRTAEPERLQEKFAEAGRGRGQFVVVTGEAGYGKTRLMHEFRKRIDRQRFLVAEGRCQSYGTATPYLPIRDALSRAIGLRERDSRSRRLEKVVSRLKEIHSDLALYLPQVLDLLSIPSNAHRLPEPLQGEERRRALEETLAHLIGLTARRRPW
ncbi:MAG: DUF2791 family P-loop domain-containing protein [SAR324 cluster bacterium]|nr:DUF2791 family P-loop domain-containing protein [SAR324 cluster bacterium]